MPQSRTDTLLLLTLCAALAGCASGMSGPEVKPEELPALEAQTKAHPTDSDLFTRLGIGYYAAKSWDRAHDALQTAVSLDHRNYRATVYLGLSDEELGQFDSARAAYGA
ncbi:MAG: tetratricopeptide repeat protein, partial [Gemmatimonadales bacterium]